MNSENQSDRLQIPWYQIGLIGATGGLCLGILKLIDCNFYVECASSNEAIAGFLTYGAYLVLGTITAIFLSDHELPASKLRKNAFILGLLAPSVLIAILNKPVDQNVNINETLEGIPKIGSIFCQLHMLKKLLKMMPIRRRVFK